MDIIIMDKAETLSISPSSEERYWVSYDGMSKL